MFYSKVVSDLLLVKEMFSFRAFILNHSAFNISQLFLLFKKLSVVNFVLDCHTLASLLVD